MAPNNLRDIDFNHVTSLSINTTFMHFQLFVRGENLISPYILMPYKQAELTCVIPSLAVFSCDKPELEGSQAVYVIHMKSSWKV